MYAITGATGNTGSSIANRLLAQGRKVRVIGRSTDRLQTFKGAEPFIADVTDAQGLTRAFSGAEAVYSMIPPHLTSDDYLAHQERVIDALAIAIEKSGVKHVVALSSIGADKSDKTGPVVGLHRFEQRLTRINSANILFLRAGYFMENTLGQAGVIRATGTAAGPLRADIKVPMIASRDIAAAAAEALSRLDCTGKQTREVLGQRASAMRK